MVALFEQYKDEDEDAMLADGIERFCSDLGVQPDEFIVLLIAWKLKGLQARFPELKAEVRSRPQFKEMYRWTYKFGLAAVSKLAKKNVLTSI
nr:hypothetical protein BaRGS_000383 [Batillaria attramentaria]